MPGDGESEELGIIAIKYTASSWGDANALELVVMDAQQCEYTKDHWVVHFQMVNFMLFELHLKY